jgi:hypothetical protein
MGSSRIAWEKSAKARFKSLGLTMARTKGAKGKIPRELEAAAKALLDGARL